MQKAICVKPIFGGGIFGGGSFDCSELETLFQQGWKFVESCSSSDNTLLVILEKEDE